MVSSGHAQTQRAIHLPTDRGKRSRGRVGGWFNHESQFLTALRFKFGLNIINSAVQFKHFGQGFRIVNAKVQEFIRDDK